MPSETSPAPAAATAAGFVPGDAAAEEATVDAAAAVPAANSSRRLGRNDPRRFLTEERLRGKALSLQVDTGTWDEHYGRQPPRTSAARERTNVRNRSVAGVSCARNRQARPISRRA